MKMCDVTLRTIRELLQSDAIFLSEREIEAALYSEIESPAENSEYLMLFGHEDDPEYCSATFYDSLDLLKKHLPGEIEQWVVQQGSYLKDVETVHTYIEVLEVKRLRYTAKNELIVKFD